MKIILLTLAAIFLAAVTVVSVITFFGVFFPMNWVMPLTLIYVIATSMVVSRI